MERLKIYMAPLQGLTEAPYRNAFEKHFGGVDVSVSYTHLTLPTT